jgi:hypothetical protein
MNLRGVNDTAEIEFADFRSEYLGEYEAYVGLIIEKTGGRKFLDRISLMA